VLLLIKLTPDYLNLTKHRSKTIQVVSDTDLFQASISNRKQLEEYLDLINFWQPENIRIRGKRGAFTITKVVFHLSDQKPKNSFDERTGKTKIIHSALGARIEGHNELHLIVYLNPSNYGNMSEREISRRFSILALRAAFFSINDSFQLGEEERQAKVKYLTQKAGQVEPPFFLLSRK